MTYRPSRTLRTITLRSMVASTSYPRLSDLRQSCVVLLFLALSFGLTAICPAKICHAKDFEPRNSHFSRGNTARDFNFKYRSHISFSSIPWQALSNCQHQEIKRFRIFVYKAGPFDILFDSCHVSQLRKEPSRRHIESETQGAEKQIVRYGFIRRARVRGGEQFSRENLPQRVTAVISDPADKNSSVENSPRNKLKRLSLNFSYYQRGTPRLRHLFVEATPVEIVRVANVPHAFLLNKFHRHDHADLDPSALTDGKLPNENNHSASGTDSTAKGSTQSPSIAAATNSLERELSQRKGYSPNWNKTLPSSKPLAVDFATTKFPETPFIPLSSALATRFISVTVQTDESFEVTKGANDNLLAMISGADAIYRDSFNTALNLEVVVSSWDNIPLQTTAPDASSRLRSYITDTMPLQPAKTDVSLLLTKRDLVGSLVGLAALGGACSQVAGAIIQSINPAIDYIILAHELGHLLSALHSSSGLMSSAISLTSPSTSFAPESLAQISSFLDSRVSCFAHDGFLNDTFSLSPSAPPPNPAEASNLGQNRPSLGNNEASESNQSLNETSPFGSPPPLPTTRPTPRPRPTPITTTSSAPTKNPVPTLSLARRGSYIEGEINLPTSVDQSCAVDLKGLIANSTLDRVRFETLSTIPVVSENLSFSLRWPNPRRSRMLPTSIKKLPTLKLRAFLRCPDQRALRSRTVTIRGSDRPNLSVSAQSFVMSLIRTTLRMAH